MLLAIDLDVQLVAVSDESKVEFESLLDRLHKGRSANVVESVEQRALRLAMNLPGRCGRLKPFKRHSAEGTQGWKVELRGGCRVTEHDQMLTCALRTAIRHAACIHASGAAPAVLTDASVAADYVASTEDLYQPQTPRPWSEIVEDVRRLVQRVIDDSGSFVVRGRSGVQLRVTFGGRSTGANPGRRSPGAEETSTQP